jgi:membrane protein
VRRDRPLGRERQPRAAYVPLALTRPEVSRNGCRCKRRAGSITSTDTRSPPERPGRAVFARRLARRAVEEYSEDHGSQLAASIAYHVLFSVFPLAIVLAALSGIVVRTTGVQADVIDAVVRNVPLSVDGEHRLRALLEGVTGSYSAVGLVAIAGLVWAASGMMAAIRAALNEAWDVEAKRPFVRGKLVDVGLVFVFGVGAFVSIAVTVGVRAVSAAGGSLVGIDPGAGGVAWLLGVLFPLAFAFAAVYLLYRLIPAVPVAASPTWQVALGVAVVFVVFENLFALYVQGFANYNAVYGSLGAVIAFMLFVYLSASIFLLGAEVASEWPRLRRAHERGEVEEGSRGAGRGREVRLRARRLLESQRR